MSKPLLLCVMGPTASGKTDLAEAVAQGLDCELISVDSALVYRGLDIGSAKPDYPHHLVDIRDPAQPYSAADFAADANRLVDEISARGKTPLLVGGTMLYFQAFLDGLADMPAADPQIRVAPADDQLSGLGKKLDLTNATRAKLNVILHSLTFHFGHDHALHLSQ